MIVDDRGIDFQPVLVPDEPSEPSGSLAWWIEQEAAKYRMIGTEAGELLFETLWQLANRIRYVDARTPTEYRDRLEVLDADLI